MSDPMVLKTQQWLNQTYGGKTGYGNNIAENGETGWTTIYALTRALQIELGITSTANNFGPSTITKFNARFPNGVQQQSSDDETESNIYGIIQGACWCKGYSTGASTITKHFYSGTGSAIKQLKGDAGCSDTSSTVTLNIMKALLSMNQFKLTIAYGGTQKIRTIQQKLNRKYEEYIGLIPCDGVYGREMNKALIIALQKVEGYSKSEATGNFGSGTKSKLPIVPSIGQISEQTEKDAIELVRYALCCNGYSSVNIDSNQWDNTLSDIIEEFQGDMCIEQLRVCTVDTWMALLISTGNPDRSCTACDTVYEIRNTRVQNLKDKGISTIGRYIIGGEGKEVDNNELKTIFDNGFKFIPIFQENGTPNINYFTAEQGKIDANRADLKARSFCIPQNSIIYFAVDTDPLDTQITSNILPYFEAIKNNIKYYKVGVYGTRNVCQKVMDKGHAITCYVSDLSTGYSGNMGFKMPNNWNFDQFAELTMIDAEGKTMAIDKVASSGKFPAVINLTNKNFIGGTFSFTGTNVGNRTKYNRRNLKIYAMASTGNVERDKNTSVLVTIEAAGTVSNNQYYDSKMILDVPCDGKIHDFSEMNDVYGKDFMRVETGVEYYATYKIHKGSQDAPTERVAMTIMMETTGLE